MRLETLKIRQDVNLFLGCCKTAASRQIFVKLLIVRINRANYVPPVNILNWNWFLNLMAFAFAFQLLRAKMRWQRDLRRLVYVHFFNKLAETLVKQISRLRIMLLFYLNVTLFPALNFYFFLRKANFMRTLRCILPILASFFGGKFLSCIKWLLLVSRRQVKLYGILFGRWATNCAFLFKETMIALFNSYHLRGYWVSLVRWLINWVDA